MTESPNELLEMLDLQSQGQGVFVGPPSRGPRTRMFGGQLLGQALAAASFTLERGDPCHSLHAYFVRPGIVGRPTEYEVTAFHDGRTFCTRQVVGVQRDGVIFQLVASFQAPDAGFEHQQPAPQVPDPESFPDEATRHAAALERATPEMREQMQRRWPVDIIPIEPEQPAAEGAAQDGAATGWRFWLRAREELPGDPNLHRCVLAYASDMGALRVCIRAMGSDFGDPDLEVASLDHALWFHADFRADQWLLFDQQAVRVGGGRGLSRGCIFDREGRLVASMAQEGVMRRRQAP